MLHIVVVVVVVIRLRLHEMSEYSHTTSPSNLWTDTNKQTISEWDKAAVVAVVVILFPSLHLSYLLTLRLEVKHQKNSRYNWGKNIECLPPVPDATRILLSAVQLLFAPLYTQGLTTAGGGHTSHRSNENRVFHILSMWAVWTQCKQMQCRNVPEFQSKILQILCLPPNAPTSFSSGFLLN